MAWKPMTRERGEFRGQIALGGGYGRRYERVIETEDAKKFSKQEDGITKNVREGLFWDEESGVWCDVTIDDFEEEKRVCHVGYVSLMPFIVGLIDHKDAKIGRVLDVLRDEEGIWSSYGIRSLSKRDADYGSGENYWKSPIWININYLIVDRLLVSPSSISIRFGTEN